MERSNSTKILVFGGGFNPPTLAHQTIMSACLKLTGFKEVWVMPSGDRFDKKINIDDDDQLTMLNLIKRNEFGNNPRLHVSNFELQLPRPTKTYTTVGYLATAYANTEFWFTFGSDSYRNMPSWELGRELQQTLNMVIVERDRIDVPKREGIIFLKLNEYKGLSSTKARIAAASGKPLDCFVCQSVKRYIEQNELYR